MAQFNGYLLQAANGVVLDKYIVWGGYKDTPDQRQDKDSYRDGEGGLHRNVLPARSTTLEITTLSGLTLEEKNAFVSAINSGLSNAAERKVTLTYWNNETGSYCTDEFYMPDMTFTIKGVINGTIVYDSMTFKFIGYGEKR